MIAKHKLTQFYTSPTAIRAVQKHGHDLPQNCDLSSLRVIGSVGEPINPSAWRWYFEAVGKCKVPVVDTYWQTETGGIIASPIPGVTPLKPGSASFPLFAVEPVLIDPFTRKKVEVGCKGVLCLQHPLPGMARTIFGDHQAFYIFCKYPKSMTTKSIPSNSLYPLKRYRTTYFDKYEGLYYTGDGAYLDEDGYLFITGRVDDVLSISGHRIGTAEIESAITKHPNVIECAVIAVPDRIKGFTLSYNPKATLVGILCARKHGVCSASCGDFA